MDGAPSRCYTTLVTTAVPGMDGVSSRYCTNVVVIGREGAPSWYWTTVVIIGLDGAV